MKTQSGQPQSRAKQVWWVIYGIILLAVLALIVWQIYRVSVGEVASYGHPVSTSEQGVPQQPEASEPDYADTPEVQALAQLKRVDPTSLGGDDNSVTFRTQSGNIICTISSDLQKYPVSDWIPRGQTPDGKPLTGAGASCAPYQYHQLTQADTHPCDEGGYTHGVQFATTSDLDVAPGACTSERERINNYVTEMDAGTLTEKVLQPNFRAQIGDYACSFESLSVTCANMMTGRGFTFDDSSYRYF